METEHGDAIDLPERTALSLPTSIIIAAAFIGGAILYVSGGDRDLGSTMDAVRTAPDADIIDEPATELPVSWGDLGIKMASVGVVDRDAFEALYRGRGDLRELAGRMISENGGGKIAITEKNSGLLLNLLWALGLGTDNPILTAGPMTDPRYGGAGNFASTGGWTIAQGDAMDHYSRHPFVTLTPAQQEIVERMAQGIYRPCCDNPVYFPDCNHGMAMLGLLELMASQNVPEEEMWRVALRVNSYWFPDTYRTIAQYLSEQNIRWEDADPRVILGRDYSSATGYQAILRRVQAPQEEHGGAGCNVEAGAGELELGEPASCGM